MRRDIVPGRPTDDAQVRLRLGPVVESDRTLDLHEPSLSERSLERLHREKYRGPVAAVLRLLREQQPIEQLDRVVLVDKAVVHELRVLMARPAIEAGGLRLLHERKPTRLIGARSTSRNGYSSASPHQP